jgi:hypothetical protein
MNNKQRIVLIGGIAVVVLMGLYPTVEGAYPLEEARNCPLGLLHYMVSDL